MSAHLRPLTVQPLVIRCDSPQCYQLATDALLDTYNNPIGRFCTRHAEIRLKEVRAGERLVRRP